MVQIKVIYQGRYISPEEKKALEDLETLIGEPIPAVEFINTFVFGFIAINGDVSILGLPNKELSTLPESIGNFSSLQELVLFSNKIEFLPESFGNLNSLKFLNLVNNKLITLPVSFTRLKSLESLFLNQNKLTSLPESFGSLTSLRRLNLGKNQLKTLPKSILELSNLEMLFIRNNPLDIDAKKLLKQLKAQGVNSDIIDSQSEEALKKLKNISI
ncbi:MAG: leucine-rich repeat domain-containing protein [Candidatus Hermodarchaeota archaeon]